MLPEEIVHSIDDGSHGDPFSVLGPHITEVEGKKKLTVRVFRPDAKEVALIISPKTRHVMTRLSEGGLFEYIFPRRKKIPEYRLAVTPFQGQAYSIDDPYRFEPAIEELDLHLWGEGNHAKSYSFMGAHPKTIDGVQGTHFVVAAPAATRVSVIGSFNQWDGRVHRMRKYHDQGLWELFIPQVSPGDAYKFELKSPLQDPPLKKADPYAFFAELRPQTASIVHSLDQYEWTDHEWLKKREDRKRHQALSVYECHLGSWKRNGEDFLSYRELADQLIPYVKELGFTHIELMPIAEHPYDPSWGYQQTGYFAATSRFGRPEDLMFFIDQCHASNIGVIVDWVPAHFAKDEHGLYRFDGTGLFEHEDARQGEHKDWGTAIFNFGRTEVQNFLISNALFWLDHYHIDGLRVDAVASMLYLDYSREDGEWIPNKYGGRENIDAIEFLKKFNYFVHDQYPGCLTFAEESTSWGGVTAPVQQDGLGFDYKWNMGWMNDTLSYIEKDPIYRRYHQGELTFSMVYAFSEQFILPFSHDEVVHMKKSMLSKMPGDDWQKFANLRLLYTYMYAHPGAKLLFMGSEFGQWGEWNDAQSLDWHLYAFEPHQQLQTLVKDLNHLHQNQASLYELDTDWRGFEWIDFHDADNSLISFVRKAKDSGDFVVVVLNFTPNVHHNYRVGVPEMGNYEVLFNSDSEYYGGSNVGAKECSALAESSHNFSASISLDIPPLAGIMLKLKN